MTNVQRRLVKWVQQNAEDWELECAWPAGNWIETPSEKWLPILLRRKRWPVLVGVALCADGRGPSSVFVGIQAPTKKEWDVDKDSVRFFGALRGPFIDDNAKQAIAVAIELAIPTQHYWVNKNSLRDIDGQDISDWRTVETIKRLYAKSGDEIAAQIVEKIEVLRQKLDGTLK